VGAVSGARAAEAEAGVVTAVVVEQAAVVVALVAQAVAVMAASAAPDSSKLPRR
jgi:hypothetical protein